MRVNTEALRPTAKISLILLTGFLLGSCAAPVDLAGAKPSINSAELAPAEIVIRTEAPPITITTEAPSATEEDLVGESTALSPSAIEPSVKAAEPATGTVEILDQIPIKGRAPKNGYDRSLFGNGWGDPDQNGCDARNDILERDLTVYSYKPGSGNCVVLTGLLLDPYTGKSIEFERGQGTSNAVQIDHVVALSDAWQKGAQQLSPESRHQFANDPLNLLAVDGPTNASKGDGDAATWLPPQREAWCDYVTRQVHIKHKYDLWMTEAEHARSKEVLSSDC